MPRAKTDLQKHTLNLRQGDYQRLGEMFPKMGGGRAIRELVIRFVDKHYRPAEDKPNLDVDIDNL